MNKKILVGLVAGIVVIGALVYGFSKNSTSNSQTGELHQIEKENVVDSVKKTPESPKAVKEKEKTSEANEEVKSAVKAKAETEEKAEIKQKVKKKQEEKFVNFVDMNKWLHNAKDKVYYQTGIVYTKTPTALKYQKMALFVPENYLICRKNADDFLSCEKSSSAHEGKYNVNNAPIFFEIDSPDFAAMPALTEYKDYSVYTKEGMVYAHIGFRGIDSGAPLGVADIKAAVKYLRRNNDRIPGNTNSIFVLGMNQGGLLAAVLGASGNDKAYMPYLQEIGALNGVDDNISGVILFNPVSGLDTANEALEWLLGSSRKDMTEEQKKMSEAMAKEYANYINRAGFIDARGRALTLQYSAKGIYQQGTYYDYIKKVIEKSIQRFIETHTFPYMIPKSWEISEEDAIAQDNIKLAGTIQSKDRFLNTLNAKKKWIFDYGIHGLKISSIKDFNRIFKRKMLPMASFDGVNKDKIANLLFGAGDANKMHFDFYTARVLKNSAEGKDFSSDLYKRDKAGSITLKRVNLYNPLYYLISSYEGYNTSTAAPYWYVRSGLFQNSDILTSSVNLYLALSGYRKIKEVDYQTVWGMGEVKELTDKNIEEIFDWIKFKAQ